MNKLVLATGNQKKVKELAAMLADMKIQVIPQSEFAVSDADETGTTFVENAIIKARHAAKATGLPAVADDSGLEVDLLQGRPGVYSARFAGDQASDRENIDKLLAEKSYYSKAEIPGGIYKGSDKPTPSIGGKAVLSTSAKTDPEVVYQLVKSVFDNLDRFKRLHPAFADLKEADMIKVGLSAPLHEGAARYYKERGWL